VPSGSVPSSGSTSGGRGFGSDFFMLSRLRRRAPFGGALTTGKAGFSSQASAHRSRPHECRLSAVCAGWLRSSVEKVSHGGCNRSRSRELHDMPMAGHGRNAASLRARARSRPDHEVPAIGSFPPLRMSTGIARLPTRSSSG
jgi:hypothetical protein